MEDEKFILKNRKDKRILSDFDGNTVVFDEIEDAKEALEIFNKDRDESRHYEVCSFTE